MKDDRSSYWGAGASGSYDRQQERAKYWQTSGVEDAAKAAEAREPVPPKGYKRQDSVYRAESLASNVRPAPSAVRRTYAVQATRQKDHISAGLLAVFLGMFGLHKFYLGYNDAAFAMLAVTVIGSIVTIGLAGAVVWVIAIIEGLIYLCKTQTAFDRDYVLNKREWF